MLKYQKWLTALIVLFALWRVLCNYLVDQRLLQIAHVLPMYLLVVFGAYSLAVIAFSVMNVTDCPEASKELERQVLEAKEDLRKKGMKL